MKVYNFVACMLVCVCTSTGCGEDRPNPATQPTIETVTVQDDKADVTAETKPATTAVEVKAPTTPATEVEAPTTTVEVKVTPPAPEVKPEPAEVTPAPAVPPTVTLDPKTITVVPAVAKPGTPIAQTVARSELVIREWQPTRGMFGGWLVDTFPFTNDELEAMAKVYDTYENPKIEPARIKTLAHLLRLRVATPEDKRLDKLLYAAAFGIKEAHPLKASLSEKCSWKSTKHMESSEGYKQFMKDIEQIAKLYGLQ